jgi:hypothetical protein
MTMTGNQMKISSFNFMMHRHSKNSMEKTLEQELLLLMMTSLDRSTLKNKRESRLLQLSHFVMLSFSERTDPME